MLPLEGIKVLDLSRILAGPWATQALGDMGAEVIKVEEPGKGDDTRSWGMPVQPDGSTYYLAANRNKKSIAIDLASEQGQELVRKLAVRSDVVIENFKVGTVERFGIDYESLRKLNPSLVYCSISGYGRTGSSTARPGYDALIQGETALMSINGPADHEPVKFGVAMVDIMTGMYVAQAVLAAIIDKLRTGKGRYIDMSLHDCGLSMLSYYATRALMTGENPVRYGNAHPDVIPYGLFHVSDGPVILACGNDSQYRKVCHVVLERPDLAEDPRFLTNRDRASNRSELMAELVPALLKLTRKTFQEKMHLAGVPGGQLKDVLEALNSTEAAERDMLQYVESPVYGRLGLLSAPFKFSGVEKLPCEAPPAVGEHTDRVLLDELGLGASQVAELRELGVVA